MARWFRYLDWPLRAKLATLLVVASLLPLAVAAYFDIRELRQQVVAQAGALLKARADELAGNLDAFNDEHRELTAKLARSPGVAALCQAGVAEAPSLRPLVQEVIDLPIAVEPELQAIAVLDARGRVLAATQGTLVGQDLARVGRVAEALQGRAVVSDVEVLEPLFGSVATITCLAPVSGADGRQSGTVAVWIRATALWELMKASNNLAGSASFAVLYDHQGIRIAHSFKSAVVFHPGGVLDPAVADALVAGQRFGPATRSMLEDVRPFPEQFARAVAEHPDEELFRGIAPIDNKPNYGVGRRLHSQPWTLFYMIPEETLDVQTGRLTGRKTLFAGLIIVAALGLGVLVAGIMLRPIRELTRAAEVLAGGDLAARVPIDRADELGRLSRRFNTMAERVEFQTRDIERSRDALEQRVRARTTELLHSLEDLEIEVTERKEGEVRLKEQLARLDLLARIARAIGERQDLESILQVVVRNLEDHLPLDFGCACLYDPGTGLLTVAGIGVRGAPLAQELGLAVMSSFAVDQDGLAHAVAGQLVYEPDIGGAGEAFSRRLSGVGLRALVLVPLRVADATLGMLIAARRQGHGFSAGEREFLQQLCELVSLAVHNSRLHGVLGRAYEDLRHSQQAVMQHERLRVMGQMASGIAHDINNAISPALLYSESLIEREQGLSARGQAQLATIRQAVEGVSRTVGRMREFYRQGDGRDHRTPVDPNRLIVEVLDLTRSQLLDLAQQRGTTVTLRSELAEDLPPMGGVISELREALVNLVLNAVEAMPEGGEVVLATGLAGIGASERVLVEVRDGGSGMSDQVRRRCLEPFFTTKGERHAGLGLAMVHGMAERHLAELSIDTVVGRGTRVRLAFPVLVEAVAPVLPPVGDVPPPPLRILVVDDDQVLLQSLEDTLRDEGHTVTGVGHGAEAIELFRRSCDPAAGPGFDLVITDLGMPQVDGRQVARAVKEAAPATPVILLTGWGQRLVDEGDVPPHVTCVLNKPPKIGELRAALVRYGRPGPSRPG